jgi:hypothetical protein
MPTVVYTAIKLLSTLLPQFPRLKIEDKGVVVFDLPTGARARLRVYGRIKYRTLPNVHSFF